MQENHLFEYAVIRIVPQVEREEFLNAGVVMYCTKKKFLDTLFQLNEPKLITFSPLLDIEEVSAYLCAFEQICKGSALGGSIAKLPLAERFRWLTATRSTVVQTSKVHPGFCKEPEEMLKRLYEQLVL